MQCPDCQKDLVEIATHEGPQLDVCPDRHGLWLDEGEVKLLVQNDRMLSATTQGSGACASAVKTPICPRCSGRLIPAPVAETSIFVCQACQGLWFREGSLTRLNQTIRGGVIQARSAEAEFYARAAGRRSAIRSRVTQHSSGQTRIAPRRQTLWFWTVFSGGVFIIASLILLAGIRNTVAAAHWTKAPDEMLFFLALGVVAGIGVFVYGFKVNRRKHLIESTPSSPVRSVAVGLVEVSGHAQPEGRPLRAPFSGIPCVLFAYQVEERRGSGKNAKWHTIAKGTSEQPFFVRDDTGRVLVIPFDADLILPKNRTTRHNWLGSLPEQAVVGLTELGIPAEGWLGRKTLRCSESFILPEETVYVLGTAHEKQGPAEGSENSARVYIGSSRDHEFIISDRSEKELLSRLRWQVFGFLAGGPILTFACLLIILKTYLTVAA